MPKPKTKKELIQANHHNFDQLLDFIDTLPPHEQVKDFPKGTLNRNIRDVLAHLYHWHQMLLRWYREGMNGKQPDMPAKGYTWKETPALNRAIRDKYSNMPLEEARNKLKSSHSSILEIIESHTDTELFEKKRYGWTGSTSLGAYIIANTSSHYQWAYKLIKKAKTA